MYWLKLKKIFSRCFLPTSKLKFLSKHVKIICLKNNKIQLKINYDYEPAEGNVKMQCKYSMICFNILAIFNNLCCLNILSCQIWRHMHETPCTSTSQNIVDSVICQGQLHEHNLMPFWLRLTFTKSSSIKQIQSTIVNQ
jgi:hypothetical protein